MNSTIVRIIGVLGILWNAGGVASYLGYVGVTGDNPVDTPMPLIVTAAFAIATWAGLAGSIGLALLKRWAAPVLWLSFAAAVVNWGWVLGIARRGEMALGLSVLVIGLVLAVVASRMTPAPARS